MGTEYNEAEAIQLCSVWVHATEGGWTGAEPAAFREGVDINWGDSLYICCSCARVIGGLFGMMDPDEVKALRKGEQALG
jgi:hypothetical protein